MKPWQIVDKYINITLEKYKEKYPEDEYSHCVGELQATLIVIMMDCNVCFPEAYDMISKKLLRKIEEKKNER